MGTESMKNSGKRTLVLASTVLVSVLVAVGLFLLVVFVVVNWVAPPFDSAEYVVIPLLERDLPTCAVSINDAEQVLVWENRHVDHVIKHGEHPMEMKAWILEPDGSLVGIPGLGGKWVNPRKINNLGTILGEAETSDGKPHGFIWEGSGEPRDLGELGFNLPMAEVFCLNDRGEMGGSYYHPRTAKSFSLVPRVWNASRETVIAYMEGDAVTDLNNEGMALIDFGSSFEGEIVSGTGERIEIGALSHQGCRPMGVNDCGEVVGYSSITSTFQGTIDGVIGAVKRRKASISWEERPHAFIWRDGKMADLNSLIETDSGWELLWAFGINNKGQIVGGGMHEKHVRAFLLEPVTNADENGIESF